ncbi:MAG: metallophosphoesterase [Firmicutes bacterium HGW-Firmicutes-15]|nr:MAG: metallophosphoesterase [Firmicutes bacterium HGW-Firmicutes-15]
MGFWSIALFILIGIIFYVGWRGQQAFSNFIPSGYGKIYWAVFLLIASSFILVERLESGSGSFFSEGLKWVGAYSVAFLFYAFLILVVIDILILLDRWRGFIPQVIKKSPANIGITVICLLVGLLVYGTWNAWNPVFSHYEINISKNTNGPQSLHAIMISDLHLGTIVNNERLTEVVNQINQQEPDLVFLVGDVIDEDIAPFLEHNMTLTLSGLRPRLGTYMVLGNHDGHGKEVVPYLEAAGVTVLNDQYALIDSSFYLIGRGNRGHQNTNASRLELDDLMAGVDKKLPIVLLDHNPSDLEEARVNGVDVQLSGHTHQGQMFPNNLITGSMYELDWGYLRKDTLQVVVSTGFGTWGPPIRIGNTPEVVDLTINFNLPR